MAKKILVTSFLTSLLFAATVSALQLKTAARIGFCRGTCSATVHCSGPCFCWIPDGSATGFCVTDPPGLTQPTAK